jgi:hypothetical protein
MPFIGFPVGISGNIIAVIFYDATLKRFRDFNDAISQAATDTSMYFSKENGIECDATALLRFL